MADEERVVHTDSSGSNMLVVVVLLVIVILFLFFGTNIFRGGEDTMTPELPSTETQPEGGEGGEGGDVNMEIPDEIDVNVNDAMEEEETQ